MVPHAPDPQSLPQIPSADFDFRTRNIRAGRLQAQGPDLPMIGGDREFASGITFADYEILGVYGRGGMGIVYRARHRTLDRIVALKVMRTPFPDSSEESSRFQLEAAAVARLDHPNIVPIYEFGEAYDQPFYSMACMEGGSLAQAISQGPLSPRLAVELILPIAHAIAYAHGEGVIHRDLKPENILLDTSGRTRLSDFGIAKFAGVDNNLTRTGDVMGTPNYMPPEQAQGRSDQIGPLVDVYALGATLYCLVTGRPPFQAATGLETLKQVVEREPISPRQLNPAVDRDLETICLKCLEKRPERRYASAQDLAEDLKRFLNHQTIQARPVSPLQKAGRWCGRNPLVAGLLVSICAVFLSAFVLVSWSYLLSEKARKEEEIQRTIATRARDDAQRHEKAERWERYRATMTTAAFALQLENVSVAARAIDDAPRDFRNWEWRYFQRLLDGAVLSLPHGREVADGAHWLPDGKLLLVTDRIEVWDLATRRVLLTLTDYRTNEFTPVVLSPDRRLLAYSAGDLLMVWDLQKQTKVYALPCGARSIELIRFTPSGDEILVDSCSTDEVVVWSASTGERVRTWSYARPMPLDIAAALGPKFLVTSSNQRRDDPVEVRDARTGEVKFLLKGHTQCLSGVTYNPVHPRIVTHEAYPSNLMRLWNSDTGQQVQVLQGHTNQVRGVAFSPSGTRMASLSFDQSIRLWDGLTGEAIATLNGHNGRVLAATFSPDGRRLASASQDRTVRLWDVESGKLIALLCGHTADVYSVAFSPDGKYLASSACDGTARLWDVPTAERTGVLKGHGTFVYDVAFHPDGERVASCSWDGTVRIWNATSGDELKQLQHGEKVLVTSVSIHPEGKILASLGRDNAVRLWDFNTGKEIRKLDLTNSHWRDTRVHFSPRGNLLASGSQHGDVYLWDAHSWERLAILRGHKDTCHDVAFSPDETWIASGGADDDRTIHIWDVASRSLRKVLPGNDHAVLSLAVSPDGALLASGSSDGTVSVWDVRTWQKVDTLKHGTNVYGLAFHPDGSRLATACADNTIRLWDVENRQEVAQFHGHRAYVHNLAFSPDGTRLVSGAGDLQVRVWDSMPAQTRAGRTVPKK